MQGDTYPHVRRGILFFPTTEVYDLAYLRGKNTFRKFVSLSTADEI